jgi:SAM-dependent methyltransferase
MPQSSAARHPAPTARICRACGSPTSPLLSVEHVPPQQNRFFASREAATDAVATSVEFLWCGACLHVGIEKQRAVGFDPHYDSRQSHSPIAKLHLGDVARRVAQHVPLDARIVEIGCGRGEFIAELAAAGFTSVVGFDPAAPAPTPLIRNEYWRGAAQGGDVDCLILRHTLEEMPDFGDFLDGVVHALSTTGRLYVEITNAAKIYETGNIWSLYPEYCNLFSAHSIGRILLEKGMIVERVDEYAGGDWLGVWARRLNRSTPYPVSPAQLAAKAAAVARLPRPIVLWGAAGRGGNFLAFLKVDRSLIAHVVDANESKWGKYVPPFGQKVVAPAELKTLKPATVLLASAKFRDEVRPHLPEGCLLLTFDDLV